MKNKLFISLFLLLAACGLENYPSGDLPSQARLNSIQIGDSRDKVLRVLGTPATESLPLSDGTSFLIYSQNIKTSRAFLDPKEVKRDVYAYYFNTKGILTEQKHLTLADQKVVSYDSDETKITGHDLSLLDQIVQNFGRYNTGSQDSAVRR